MKKKLIEKVIDHIREDINSGNYRSLERLLKNIPNDVLLSSLPKDVQSQLMNIQPLNQLDLFKHYI